MQIAHTKKVNATRRRCEIRNQEVNRREKNSRVSKMRDQREEELRGVVVAVELLVHDVAAAIRTNVDEEYIGGESRGVTVGIDQAQEFKNEENEIELHRSGNETEWHGYW